MEIGAYSPETARTILEVVNYLKSNGFVITSGQKLDQRSPVNPADPPLWFRNDSGETIPPYACMQVVGTVEVGGRNYFKVDKPADSNAEAGPYLFNLHREVLDGEYGIADAGVETRTLSDSPSAAAGTRMSPQADSWKLKESDAGQYSQAGADDLDAESCRVMMLGQGAVGGMIVWESDEPDLGAEDELCANQVDDAITSLSVRVVRRPCGVDRVHGEDDSGFVTVVDDAAGGFFTGRSDEEMFGISGFAVLMSNRSTGECEWVITWINWFQERTFVQDWYVSGLDIIEEKVNAYVWDWCRLPNEVTEGVDCSAE